MQSKAYKGMGMEGRIARWYASTTKKSLKDFQELAERLTNSLRPGSRVLEVAPGPGYLAIELAQAGHVVVGLDISKTFVEIARENAREQSANVDFQLGDAAHMPLESASFDLVVCRAAFKNFAEPAQSLKEMYRVLKPGGSALIIDLRKDASNESIRQEVDRMGLGTLNSLFVKWTFRLMLLKRAYTKQQFQQFISESGFEKTEINESRTGFEIWLRKTG